MGFSKLRVTYLIGVVAGAFWLSWYYYQKGLSEASLMAEVTSIFSNIVFVGILLMGFALFMLRKSRRVI